MATKNIKVTVEARNAVAVALLKRHGGGNRFMKDRRASKGGTRNKQREYREERY